MGSDGVLGRRGEVQIRRGVNESSSLLCGKRRAAVNLGQLCQEKGETHTSQQIPKTEVARYKTMMPGMPVARRGMCSLKRCMARPPRIARRANEMASQKAPVTRSQRRPLTSMRSQAKVIMAR